MVSTRRVALVTGGGGGIGRAAALGLNEQGIRVAVADVSEEGMELTKAGASDQSILCVQTDVRDHASVKKLVQTVMHEFGRIDILVNCAGIFPVSRVAEMGEDEWDRVIETNLKGAFLCSQAVLAPMRAQGAGRIVSIGSGRGTDGYAGGAHYAASKGGLIGFTKSLALEMINDVVTVNIIAPGITDTPMMRGVLTSEQVERFLQQSPGSRLGKPEDIVALLLYLVSEQAAHVTGQVFTLKFP